MTGGSKERLARCISILRTFRCHLFPPTGVHHLLVPGFGDRALPLQYRRPHPDPLLLVHRHDCLQPGPQQAQTHGPITSGLLTTYKFLLKSVHQETMKYCESDKTSLYLQTYAKSSLDALGWASRTAGYWPHGFFYLWLASEAL